MNLANSSFKDTLVSMRSCEASLVDLADHLVWRDDAGGKPTVGMRLCGAHRRLRRKTPPFCCAFRMVRSVLSRKASERRNKRRASFVQGVLSSCFRRKAAAKKKEKGKGKASEACDLACLNWLGRVLSGKS